MLESGTPEATDEMLDRAATEPLFESEEERAAFVAAAKGTDVCCHGCQQKKCETCEARAEVERLRAALDTIAWRAERARDHAQGEPATLHQVCHLIAGEARAALEGGETHG